MSNNPELGVGKYSAEQVPGAVIIHAWGETPTPNYKVWLQPGPEDIFPPIYDLWWLAPGGVQPQIETPFHVHAAFAAEEPIRSVTVRDANGSHTVPVEQVPD